MGIDRRGRYRGRLRAEPWDREKLLVGFWFAAVGIVGLILLFWFGGCSGTWDQNAKKGIAAIGSLNKATVDAISGDKFCRPIVENCKAKSDKTCAQLELCQRAQIKTLQGIGLINQGAKSVLEGIELYRQFKAVIK